MVRKILKSFWAVALLSLIYACGDDDGTPAQITSDDIATAQDFEAAQAAFADATLMSEQALSDDQGSENGRSQLCFETSQGDNNELIISFNGECADNFGVTRSGSIIYSTTGNLFEEGFQFNISFDDYSRDGYILNGTISSGDWGFNNNQNLTYTNTITDGSLEFPDGSEFKLNRTLTFEWAGGLGTGDLFDNVYKVTGNSSGVNRNGVAYTADIIEPITVKSACWSDNITVPVQGSFKINAVDRPEVVVDYGDGSCDNEGTISVGSFTQDISL